MDFGKIFSGWQIILLRHTGDFQKTVLLMLQEKAKEVEEADAGAAVARACGVDNK